VVGQYYPGTGNSNTYKLIAGQFTLYETKNDKVMLQAYVNTLHN